MLVFFGLLKLRLIWGILDHVSMIKYGLLWLLVPIEGWLFATEYGYCLVDITLLLIHYASPFLIGKQPVGQLPGQFTIANHAYG